MCVFNLYTITSSRRLNFSRASNDKLRSSDKSSQMRDNAPTRSQRIGKLMMTVFAFRITSP